MKMMLISCYSKLILKGMNFGIMQTHSIVLMSTEKNAPYNGKLLNEGVIEYEGHDAPTSKEYNKKEVDQPVATSSGTLTENGKFVQAVDNYKSGKRDPAAVKVYRKIRKGVWVDMGFYDLVDSCTVHNGVRNVFKFILKPNYENATGESDFIDLDHNRQIPGEILREVWERDKGKCQICGLTDNLHYDHILPFSKGGSSKVVANIQLLCARHNLKKGARFE